MDFADFTYTKNREGTIIIFNDNVQEYKFFSDNREKFLSDHKSIEKKLLEYGIKEPIDLERDIVDRQGSTAIFWLDD